MEINVVNSLIEAINELDIEEKDNNKANNFAVLKDDIKYEGDSKYESEEDGCSNVEAVDDEEDLNKELISAEEIKKEFGISGLFERLLQDNKNLKYKDLIISLKEKKSYKRKNMNDELIKDLDDFDFDDSKNKEKFIYK